MIGRQYLLQKKRTPQDDVRNLFKSEKSSTLTWTFTSPRVPCIVSNMGSQPDNMICFCPSIGTRLLSALTSNGLRSMYTFPMAEKEIRTHDSPTRLERIPDFGTSILYGSRGSVETLDNLTTSGISTGRCSQSKDWSSVFGCLVRDKCRHDS